MPTTTPTPDAPAPDPEPAAPRRALPWQAVVAATVLALTAAGLVFVFLGGTDSSTANVTSTPDDTQTDGTLQLTPADRAVDRDGAVDLEFTDAAGTTTGTLRGAVDGRPMVVNFFASWCPPCIGEMPEFEAAAQDFAGDVDFLGLAVQDRPEDATRIVDDTGVTYPWFRDIRGDIAGAVGVVQMPTTMLLDADGEIVTVHSGALDADDLRDLIEEHFGVTP